MINKPRLDRLTQGSIFCGAIAEDYADRPVWGLVITARCDTAHEKVPIVNYLPLIRVEDWLSFHGAMILLDRLISDLENRLGNLLEKKGLNRSLLVVHTPDEILKANFPKPIATPNSKKAQAEQKDFELAYQLVKELSDAKALYPVISLDIKKIFDVSPIAEALMTKVSTDLLSGTLAGYYFIPSRGIDTEHQSSLGYVVLLREIHHIHRGAVPAITRGADVHCIPEGFQKNLSFNPFDFICPVAEISSPWIEHLMQAFCNLFGRIGIADTDKSLAKTIVAEFKQIALKG